MFLSKANHKDSEIPTSSLADIVFLLLIFFLVTTSIDTEKGINLLLPSEGKDPTPRDRILNVLVNNFNQIAIDGVHVSKNELKQRVRSRLSDQPKLIVSLKTDRQTSYQSYITVLESIKEAYGDKTPKISIVPPDMN